MSLNTKFRFLLITIVSITQRQNLNTTNYRFNIQATKNKLSILLSMHSLKGIYFYDRMNHKPFELLSYHKPVFSHYRCHTTLLDWILIHRTFYNLTTLNIRYSTIYTNFRLKHLCSLFASFIYIQKLNPRDVWMGNIYDFG